MTTVEQVVSDAAAALDQIDDAREQALATSRALIRLAANTIRAVHRQEFEEAQVLLNQAGQTSATLRETVTGFPTLVGAGYTQDAFKEYAEAHLTYAFVRGEALPSYSELNVEPAAYLNGLAEAASELRRFILDSLRRGSLERCEELLSAMDEVYSRLISVDYTDAVTGGLRRTTDALRGVLERTRGDLTAAVRQQQLAGLLESFEARLGGTEGLSA